MNTEPRYRVLDSSVSGHCCFAATVVDSANKEGHWRELHIRTYGYDFAQICECFSVEEAQLIADALNEQDAHKRELELSK